MRNLPDFHDLQRWLPPSFSRDYADRVLGELANHVEDAHQVDDRIPPENLLGPAAQVAGQLVYIDRQRTLAG